MNQIITDNYEIYYNNRNVIVYSSERVLLESKGWQTELKRDVRTAIEQLYAVKGESLVAVYGVDNDRGFIDTENALFYNIGTAAFREIGKYGIAFNTLSQYETNRLFINAGKPKYHHYYSYQISSFYQHAIRPLLLWENIPIFSLKGEHKPFDYWRLIRTYIDEVKIFCDDDYTGGFGIELHFYEPENKPINIANTMKPLIDGIICAFHKMPDDIDEDVLTNVSTRLNLTAEHLLYKSKAILGDNIFVKPYRKNVFWSPQDDRCLSVSINMEYGVEKRCFSGRIYPA